MIGDLGIDHRRWYADLTAEGVHTQLVVYQGISGARVVIEDALGVATVHAEDAEFL